MQGKFVPITEMIGQSLSLKDNDKNIKDNSRDFKPISSQKENPQSKLHQNAASFTPQIELKKEGNRLTKIILRCPCGQVYTFNCVYTVPMG